MKIILVQRQQQQLQKKENKVIQLHYHKRFELKRPKKKIEKKQNIKGKNRHKQTGTKKITGNTFTAPLAAIVRAITA